MINVEKFPWKVHYELFQLTVNELSCNFKSKVYDDDFSIFEVEMSINRRLRFTGHKFSIVVMEGSKRIKRNAMKEEKDFMSLSSDFFYYYF